MKTRTHTLSLGLAAALVAVAMLSASQAQAGHGRARTVAVGRFGGPLVSIARGRDDHRGRVIIQVPAGHCRPRSVFVRRPAVVYRPPHRPICSRRQWGYHKPVLTHCVKPCCRPVKPHHVAPRKHVNGNDRYQPGGHSQGNRGGRQGHGRR